MTARCSPPCPARSPWPSPSRLSLSTMTGPSTGSFQMPVCMILLCHCTSLGIPTFTETSLATVSPRGSPRLGQRFAAVDLQRHTGQEAVGHREQHCVGDVVGRPDSPGGIGGADVLEIVALTVPQARRVVVRHRLAGGGPGKLSGVLRTGQDRCLPR